MTESNWAQYRILKWTFWSVLVPGLVAVLALAELVLIERHGAAGLAWPAGIWFVLTVWAGMRWQRFRCPRCGKRFFRSLPPLLALRRHRCVHCSLSKH